MTGYVIRRLVSLAFVLWAVATIVFLLMSAVPGGPFTLGERGYSEEAMKNVLAKYGLDKPLGERYVNYFKDLLRFDFGYSFAVAGSPPVSQLIRNVWPVTLHVGMYTILVAFSLGITLGIIGAYDRNSWIDTGVTLLATLGLTIPSFVIATWFLLAFGFQVGWGQESKWIIGPVVDGGNALLSWDYFLPVITYALGPLAVVARFTRSSVSDAMSADYIRTARAKGISERGIMTRHVMRNALIPMVTVLLPVIPDLLTGSIFVEAVFGIPGLGKFFVTSIFARDYPMVMALVLLIAFFWGLTYLITDVLYTIIDPRIRVAGARSS
jgi:ABC-type dipeptide/oligopeptide/nickel transport system permease component